MTGGAGGGRKMTRETKVGLVVAGSFLCLVGVVVFMKFREGQAPRSEPEARREAEPSPVVVEAPAPVAGDRGDSPAGPTIVAVSGPLSLSQLPRNPPDPPPLDPVARPEAGSQPATTAPVVETASPVPLPMVEPPPPGAIPVSPGVTPPSAAPSPTTSGAEPPAVPLHDPIPERPATASPPSAPVPLPTPAAPAASPEVAPPPLQPEHRPVPAAPGEDNRSMAPPAEGRAIVPGSVEVQPPLPPTPPPAGTAPGANLGQPVIPPAVTPPAPARTGDPAPSPPIRPIPGASEPARRTGGNVTPMGPDPLVQARATAPVGTPIGAPVPAVPGSPVRPLIGTVPQVESFDEEEYRARVGDTFQSISMQFYRTDKYAQALLLFNRSHPLASEAIRQDPPALRPGQAVYVPPGGILERRHGTAVPELTPLPPTGAPRTDRPLYAPTEGTAAAGSATYRVQGIGESWWEIARKTLRGGERWYEIQRLNPEHRAELPVPGGTLLRLPPEAVVEPVARP